MWCTTFDAGNLQVRFDEGNVETELWHGYLGTAKRKGRKQTNRTYCYRAVFLLYPNAIVIFSNSSPEAIGGIPSPGSDHSLLAVDDLLC